MNVSSELQQYLLQKQQAYPLSKTEKQLQYIPDTARYQRYGIFSDIHGNLEALQAVLARLHEEQVEQLICLGDFVGYGANPCECIDLILEQNCWSLAGCMDYTTIGKVSIDFWGSAIFAQQSIFWTRTILQQRHRDFLMNLELAIYRDDMTLVHSTPNEPEMFNFIHTTSEATESMENYKGPVCFIGHLHIPTVFYGIPAQYSVASKFTLPNRHAIVNVGSVGQPHDRDPRACCVVYDTSANQVTFHRVEYDVEAAAAKIIAAGLPEVLAERLRYGR